MSLLSQLRSPSAAPVATRADTTSTSLGQSVYSGSALLNALSGLGGARDSGATARPNVGRMYLTDEELVTLMRGTIYRRIVETLPRWGTKKGWTITDDSGDKDPLSGTLKTLEVRSAIRRAAIWGRALGESRIWIVTNEPDPSKPLEMARVRSARLQVLDRREFTPVAFESVGLEGELGMPSMYAIHPSRSGLGTQTPAVHASRLLRFYGDELPPSDLAQGFRWGADAVGQTIWHGLRDLGSVSAGGAKIAQEISLSVFKMIEGPSKQAGDEAASFQGLMRFVNMTKSIMNAIFLTGEGDSFERVPANPAGFKDLSDHARLELAMLANMPMQLLYGQAPSGLSTDGESWQASWYGQTASWQDERLRPPLETLIELAYHLEGREPPEAWSVDFNPLRELTEDDKATIRGKIVQADSIAILDGVITPEEARTRYTEPGGFRFDLQPVDEQIPEEEMDPELINETENMVREQIRVGLPDSERGSGDTPVDESADPRADEETSIWIGLPLPESAHDAWSAARDQVAEVVDLEPAVDDPHVTVLYLGSGDDDALEEVLDQVREAAAVAAPWMAEADAVRVFPASDGSDGRRPVVLRVGRWGVADLRYDLLDRLAHRVTQPQFAPFRAHLTLGYASELDAETEAALLAVDIDEVKWMCSAIEVRRGRTVVATIPMTRADEGE